MTATPVLWGDTPVTWADDPVLWGAPVLPVPVCLVAAPAFTTDLDAPLRLVDLAAVPAFTTHIDAEVHLCPR